MRGLLFGLIIGLGIGFVVFAYTPLGNRYFFENHVMSDAVIVFKYDKWMGNAYFCVWTKNIDSRCYEITEDMNEE